MIRVQDANSTWLALLYYISQYGIEARPRDMLVKERLGVQTRFSMQHPVVNNHERKIGRRFLAGEAWWILSGRNDVESISPYSSQIANFSDDGYAFFGAYGPKIVDQMTYVVGSLISDPDTRQAVINIWRESPRKSKDVPCTLSVQFLLRDGFLCVVDTMRSSDIWLGWPYDAFNFSMLGAYVALRLREVGIPVKLGDLIMNFGSSHLYERNFEDAKRVLQTDLKGSYSPPRFDLDCFTEAGHLFEWLELAKDNKLERFDPLYEVFK